MRFSFLSSHLKATLGAVVFTAAWAGFPSFAHADLFSVRGNLTTATALLNIESLSANQLVFNFANTTPGGPNDTSLTGIGFDLAGSGAFALLTPSPNNTNFQFTTSAGNMPQFSRANLDFALVTGNNGKFSGGNPPRGLRGGQASGTYTVTSAANAFAGLSQLQVAQSVYVRFQSIPGNPGSDVGHAAVALHVPGGSAVPEPGTIALFASGMLPAALGTLCLRRKRQAA